MDEILSLAGLTKNYEIGRELGRGAMGIVYYAIDKRLDRPVAIKVLNLSALDEYMGDSVNELIERFNREAKAVAKLVHPNIVSIYDIGKEKNMHYMVMECLEGIELSRLKSKNQKLDIEQIINIGIQISSALDFAHQNGIIHRDIKPANIILTNTKISKLMDFGIAQLNKDNFMRLTQEGSILGSLMYISPEQLSNSTKIDARADIFSLGITLYELLTGIAPFAADNVATLITNILKEIPVTPSEYNPEIPKQLDMIILKSLEKDLNKRYQSAGDMGKDLTGLLNSGVFHFQSHKTVSATSEHSKMEEELRRGKEELLRVKEQIEKQKEEILRAERAHLQKMEEEIKREKERLEKEKQLLESQKKEEKLKTTNPDFRLTNPNIGKSFSQPVIVTNNERNKVKHKEILQNNELFEKSKRYITEEDYDAAIGNLRTLIDMHPKVAEFHSYLGLALFKKGWDGYAQAEFKIALHFEPGEPLALKYYKPSTEAPNYTRNTVVKPSITTNLKESEPKNAIFSKIKGLFGG